MPRLLARLRNYWRTRRWISRFCSAWTGAPFSLDHYYSPLPDLIATKKNVGRWFREGDFSSLEIDVEAQRVFLQELTPWQGELADLPNFESITKQRFGPGYGEVEAELLHLMIRRFKPKRIIEIGSGVSTRFAVHSLEKNAAEGAGGTMTCVEPHPWPPLKEMAKAGRIVLEVKEVQDAESALFDSLQENDILFIDSSHAGKIDSDIYTLFLEVLPRLKPGVLVHIHDITFPYLTTPPEHVLFDYYIYWNESAFVKAFLSFNRAFEILVCQSWLHCKAPDALSGISRSYERSQHFPTSLWIRRRNEAP